jgi:hypothetical protein
MKMTLCAAIGLIALSSVPAAAKQVCGWYAIAACTRSFQDANEFMTKGWGFVINTTDFKGLKPGYFCVASGPQTKAGAGRDRNVAMADGVAAKMYIKRACVDDNRFSE